jgi:hypothetical protein
MGGIFDNAVSHRVLRINALRRSAAATDDPRWRAKLLRDLAAERRALAGLLSFARRALRAVS